jgi:Ca-activated chloride channel homolog
VSAIVLQEKELLDYNAGIVSGAPNHNPARVPLVPIYPSEGTFVADHPYILLNWTSAQEQANILRFKRIAANAFFDFLSQDEKSRLAIDKARFRAPGDTYAAGTIGQAVRAGLDDLGPSSYTQQLLDLAQPLRAASLPLGPTLVAEIDSWTLLRRPMHVAMLIDSVNYDRVREPHLALPQDLQPRDAVGLWTFPSTFPSGGPFSVMSPVVPATPEHLDAIRRQLTHLVTHPPPSPSPYDAVMAAVSEMGASFDPTAINAVLVIDLSTSISGSPTQLERFLENQPEERFVRVFTVGAAEHPLRDIASAGHGSYYSPASVDNFLTDAAAHL